MAFLSVFVMIFFVFGFGMAEIATPEPGVNEPGLYLVTAGLNSKIIRPLSSREQICLKDYPTGISVLCVGNSRRATFYVNGLFVIREYIAPFYIRGDVGNRVRAWHPAPQVNWVKCRLRHMVVFKSRIYNRACWFILILQSILFSMHWYVTDASNLHLAAIAIWEMVVIRSL